MNPASFALNKRTVMVVMTILLIMAGFMSYRKLGRLENPNFTIKTALVVTQYPGASPSEVEEEVTDPIEEAIQSMSQLKEVYSTSMDGLSIVYVDIQDAFNSTELPQIWDELRKKISDMQGELPPGAEPSIVNDDFGDVYGVFFAMTGAGHTYADLKAYAEELKTELLHCDDVAKIAFWGLQQEMVFVEFERARLTELGLSPEAIAGTLQSQNAVQPSGKVEIDGNYIRITPTGDFASEQLIADLYVGNGGELVRLGDIATIRRGYYDPKRQIMSFNGEPAIGIGISTVVGGNVVAMGESIKEKLAELELMQPEGIELHSIYYQSEMVTGAVNGFVLNLIEAVVIVVVLLMFFMGWQSGLLIGAVLVLNICGTLLGMFVLEIELQKVSLGALILALGMLVDNAIVVADGILIRVARGESREEAAFDVVRDTQWPLLGATLISILAFTAVGFSAGNVGEFCRSLFDVMMMSLLFSWVLAVTVTPLFCVWFLKIPDTHGKDPYDKPMFRRYRKMLHAVAHHRVIAVAATVVLLVAAVAGFKKVPQTFFPESPTPYFYINYWRPAGTHINRTAEDLDQIDAYIRSLDGVKQTSSYAGEGTLRFMLLYNYETPDPSYGMVLVEADDYHDIDRLVKEIDIYMKENCPEAEPYCSTIPNGPPMAFYVEARFFGPDKAVLESLGKQALEIMRAEPTAKDARLDWRQPVQVLRPHYSETQARRVGVTRADLASALQLNFNGTVTGLYREGNELIPIMVRPPESERTTVDNLNDVQVWSSTSRAFIPINQVVSGMENEWEWPYVMRRDRRNTITARCNPVYGLADTLRLKVAEQIEAIELPPGYRFEWAGEFKESAEAQAPLAAIFPICLLGMFVITVWLFNSVRRPLIIFMTVPLSIIGVTAALLLTGFPFGFMCILGFLGLSGMLIKNAVVLIDEIELQLKRGVEPYKAVLDSSVSRVRPVVMAAGTTILGMAPLLTDALYSGMAVTIMGGLFAATFLTLIIVPVVYTLVYRIKVDPKHL
ncbi:efflux RND transporter permease subunit [Pontiella sulfatireligans]|uniref:Cobalt-zinc-cadmium resistance protein CzcA n=1 Tax=Pontiella sulfatireligans TaxID=2750658 RepID=A0A6C2UMD4_9BACT|nr:efflux RND transporter permease subunit [Pontiella sulfatireligans]VGO20276.1 Cobalt-zinc-cadmium resistance protein CzcA [Pontiella sulfatireligans]